MFVFSFQPKTDDEIAAIQNQGLLEEGIYPFIVRNVEQVVSHAGNPMLKISLGILESKGSTRNITDYLLATDRMIFKLKHFCDAIGFEGEYAKGSFDPSLCLNRTGSARIGVQKGNQNEDGSGYYPDKNTIKDYIKCEKPLEKVAIDLDLNDNVPF